MLRWVLGDSPREHGAYVPFEELLLDIKDKEPSYGREDPGTRFQAGWKK